MTYPTLDESIGNTPLVRLQRLSAELMAPKGNVILGKLEGNNPAGSVKDRPALSMIKRAEERGEIKTGDTLIEATSGNTGIALAFVAAAKGYKLILTMPETMSTERRTLLALLGAEAPGAASPARSTRSAGAARTEAAALAAHAAVAAGAPFACRAHGPFCRQGLGQGLADPGEAPGAPGRGRGRAGSPARGDGGGPGSPGGRRGCAGGRGRCPGVTVRLSDSSRLWTRNTAATPGLSPATLDSSSDTLPMPWPPTSTITSPGRMPAFAAGPFCSTPVIRTPLDARVPKVSRSSGVRSAGSTPIQPRRTTPSFTMPSSTRRAVDTGMAKPMPMLPPERE